MVITILIDGPSLVLSSQPDLHKAHRVYNHYNYFVTGEDEKKPIFVFTSYTVMLGLFFSEVQYEIFIISVAKKRYSKIRSTVYFVQSSNYQV
jgi:hypothetical protein